MRPLRALDRRRVAQLLSSAKRDRSAERRIETFSRYFLGHAYTPNPLVGSAESPEVFTASLDGLDCVTYIETVLALARATSPNDFVDWLREIRYERGRIDWKRRHHYMTQWIRDNERRGIVRSISVPAVPILSRVRMLDVVPGLGALQMRIKYMSKRSVSKLEPHLKGGDLIFFVSTRVHLDVFHAGIIVRAGNTTRIRHASRSRGSVVEQELSEFLKTNRMAGVIVVRPQELARKAAASA